MDASQALGRDAARTERNSAVVQMNMNRVATASRRLGLPMGAKKSTKVAAPTNAEVITQPTAR